MALVINLIPGAVFKRVYDLQATLLMVLFSETVFTNKFRLNYLLML